MQKKDKKVQVGLSPAIRQIRREIAAVELICSGTLLKRWKQCGRPNCRCAHDPSARHGPYYEWSRRQKGRFLHSLLSPQQAESVTQAIKNHQRILTLLATWSLETTRALNIKTKAK